jgi:hypothetical protein
MCIIGVMRTTLNLDDDVVEAVKAYSENHCVSLGKAASDLLRKGLAFRTPTKIVNGLVVFDLPPGSPPVTTELIKRLESELDESELK